MWPWPWRYDVLFRRFRAIVKRAGLYTPGRRGNLFHRIRRSTASYVKLNGGDATGQLGHSGPSVTKRYYDPRIVGQAHAVRFMPQPKGCRDLQKRIEENRQRQPCHGQETDQRFREVCRRHTSVPP